MQGWLLSTHSRSQSALPLARQPGFESPFLYFLAVQPWTKCLPSQCVPQFPHNLVLGSNTLVYLKYLTQDLRKRRYSVYVSSCDCYSLKTGLVSLEMFRTLLGGC